jgi:hypothetical protein
VKSKIAIAAVAGLAAAASAQSASVILSASATTVQAGDSFTITATAAGDAGIFNYNLLVDAIAGLGLISGVSDLVDNPTGSTSIFGAPAGAGLGAGSGFGVDRRDASAGVLIAPIPIDNIPFFSFTVTTAGDALGTITYGSATGSGTTAALTFPDASIPPIIRGANYANISFGEVSVNVVPAPATLALVGLGGFVASRRRR